MSYILEKEGIQPQVREQFELRDKALVGDMVMVITPETVAPLPTSLAWARNVLIEVKTAAGEVHTWLNKAFVTTASIADTSTLGTATIDSTTLTLVNGKATIVVEGDAQDWLHGESDTLTIGNLTIMGYTVTGGTSVENFTTP